MWIPRTSGHRIASARVEQCIVIERSVEDVFAFYQDFRNLPAFLGDVVRVEITGDRISRWTIKGPFGLQLHWTVIVTDMRSNAFIAYQAKSAAPTRWEVSFSHSAPRATMVREVMMMPGGLITEVALTAMGKSPVKEVRANLERLKELLEIGHVATTDYAVAGKFRS